MNDQQRNERNGHGDANANGPDDATTTASAQSKIENQNSKFANHPLGPEFLETYRALGRHRHALDGLLLCAITDAAGALAEAAAGNSPFHNEIEFRAASKLLDLLPLLQHPDDVETTALRRLEERKERHRKREAERQGEQKTQPEP